MRLRLVRPSGADDHALATVSGRGLVWSADSRMLYTTRMTANRTIELVEIDTRSGGMRDVSTLGTDFNFATPDVIGLRFTLAEDGKSFLATVVRRRSELWILEQFTPRGGMLDWLRVHR